MALICTPILGYNKEDIDGKFTKYIKETEESNSQSDVDTLTTRISTLTHVSFRSLLSALISL